MVADRELITGTMVAAKGILSTKAEATAESQMRITIISDRLPPVIPAMPLAMASSTPVCSNPLTVKNRPRKKSTVCQSTFRSSRSGAGLASRVRMAATMPTVATVSPVLAWVTSSSTVTRKMVTLTTKAFRLEMDARGSSDMAAARAVSSRL
ncbi:unknown [Firmicutes bacterium CAG:114]|nr:unknown [Firmicutes bacterium CAG:114]